MYIAIIKRDKLYNIVSFKTLLIALFYLRLLMPEKPLKLEKTVDKVNVSGS